MHDAADEKWVEEIADTALDEIRERLRRAAFKWIRILCLTKKKNHTQVVWFLVDDIGLEPMTFRTSSGCSSQLS